MASDLANDLFGLIVAAETSSGVTRRLDWKWLSLTLLTNLLSLAACLWLLWRFRRLSQRVSLMLLPRQIWHLAVADLCLAATVILYSSVEIFRSNLLKQRWYRHFACDSLMYLVISSMYVSAMVETHLALGFAFSYWRSSRALKVLNAVLIWLWPVGLVLGLIDVMSSRVGPNFVALSQCDLERATVRLEAEILLLFCFLLSLAAYAVSIYVVQHSPGSVQVLVWRMGWIYPANFFVTYGLLLVYYVWPNSLKEAPALFYLALTFEGLNGLVNALSYAWNCRYLRKSPALHEAILPHLNSASTGAAPGAAVEETRGRLSEFVEFHVAFCESLDSVVTVTVSQSSDSPVLEPTGSLHMDEAEELLIDIEAQDDDIAEITRYLASTGAAPADSVPPMPQFDTATATAEDIQKLVELHQERERWLNRYRDLKTMGS